MSEENKPGCLLPALWFGAAFLGLLIAGALVGWAGYRSESAGTRAAMVAAFPLGFLWSGALGATWATFRPPEKALVRHGIPMGCGCFGALGLTLTLVVFFMVIWPML